MENKDLRSLEYWKRINCKVKAHLNTENHTQVARERINVLAQRNHIDLTLQKLKDKNTEEHTEVLESVIHVVKCLVKQGIAFRGAKDAGNLGAVLDLLSIYSPALKRSPDKKKGAVNMTSQKVQNELFNIIEEDFLLNDIIEEVKQSIYYSIIADEGTTHHKQFMSFCLRCVDSKVIYF